MVMDMSNELDTQMNILSMMYSKVKALSNDIIYCEQDNLVELVNKHGIKLISATKDTMKLVGNFILGYNISNETTTIYSFTCNKRVELKQSEVMLIKELGSYLQLKLYDYKYLIIDNNLNILFSVNSYSAIAYINGNKIKVNYTLDGFKQLTATISTITKKVESYDSVDIDDTYSIIATEYHKGTGYTFNSSSQENLKYKLAKHGIIKSDKAYEDIIKPHELECTNTFYVYEYNKEPLIGLLRDDGKELLEPIYSSINYIGADNYILTYMNYYKAIYNSHKGVIFDFNEVKCVSIHANLPITVVQFTNNSIKLINHINGDIFNANELSKQFKCYYSKQNNNIIKVKLDYSNKYITNRLVPITNMHEISKIANNDWVEM